MVQRKVNYQTGKAYEGMVASTNLYQIRGALPEFVAYDDIPVGRATVLYSQGKNQIQIPTAAGKTFAGVVRLNNIYGDANIDEFLAAGEMEPHPVIPKGQPIGVMTKGDIWVWSETRVEYGDKAFFRHSRKIGAAEEYILGRFRTDDDEETAEPVPNGVFVTETNVPGLVVLSLNHSG